LRGTKSGKKFETTCVVKPKDVKVDDETYKRYVKEVYDTVFSVLKRSLFIVVRFAQGMCTDLSDKGLMVDMSSELRKAGKGMSLVIHFEPTEETILEAVKNASFRKLIRRMEKESRKVRKGEIRTGHERGVYGGKKA